MDKKTPTVEALDAALSAHYEPLSKDDRTEQMEWFLDAVAHGNLVEHEIAMTIEDLLEYSHDKGDVFSIPGLDLVQLITQTAAKFFFVGWNVRGAIEDDEKLQSLQR